MATELTTILLESQSQLIESLQHRGGVFPVQCVVIALLYFRVIFVGADVSIRRLAEQKLISAEQNNFVRFYSFCPFPVFDDLCFFSSQRMSTVSPRNSPQKTDPHSLDNWRGLS